MRRGRNFRSVIGEKWGMLTVLSEREEVGKSNGGKYYRYVVLVKCDCGSIIKTKYEDIRLGIKKSCGCRMGNWGSVYLKNSHSKEYATWRGIIERCTNPENNSYKRYGGNGIVVCEGWLNSFDSFYLDMGDAPSPKHSIERVDNEKGYCKENCTWATSKEQANNRSTNRVFTIDGETKNLMGWVEYFRQDYDLVWARLKLGWNIKEALKLKKLSTSRNKYYETRQTEK